MIFDFQSKLPNVGTTIFSVMSQMATAHGAINLSQGFPSFDVPLELKDFLTEAVAAGHNQYAAMAGVPSLREQIALKVNRLYGSAVCPEKQITVTSGATEALFAAVSSVVRPGDEVIVFDPSYDSYEPAITLNGGITVHIPLLGQQYRVDWQRLRDTITQKTRLIIFNFPHNPSGSVLLEEDLRQCERIVRNSNIFVLSDEVYEHIVFDGITHQSFLRSEELAARSFVVSSFGKTYHATGWKVGYCVAPESLSVEFRKVHQYLTFCTTTPIQHALGSFMEQYPDYHVQLPNFYQKKRDYFCQLLSGSKFRLTPTRGTYFQLLDYSELSEKNDMSYAAYLTKEVGVASIPVSVFCQRPSSARVLRFCFAKEDTILEKAAELLCQM